ncbi:MAG: hypothetical protein FJ333_11580 [Sphingomonadales bacterium]|nr:hypothetical protein [Sphingomonadales bacterium]
MEEFSYHEALINLSLLKKNLFMSAFPGKVIFGEIIKFSYNPEKTFIIHRCKYVPFFNIVLEILSAIAEKKPLKTQLDSESFCEVTNTEVTFGNAKVNIALNNEEFLNFIENFKNIILISLLLNYNEIEILDQLSYCSMDKILDIGKNKSNIARFIESLSTSHHNFSTYIIIVETYFDLIVVLHKLNSLCKDNSYCRASKLFK